MFDKNSKEHKKKYKILSFALFVDILCLISVPLYLLISYFYNFSYWYLVFLMPITTYVFLYLISLLLCFFFSLFYSKTKEYKTVSKFAHLMFNFSYNIILSFFRIRINVEGIEKIKDINNSFLLVSNHLSRLDNMIYSIILSKYNIGFISKPSNFKIPFGNRYMNRNFYLKLDRDNNFEAAKTIIKASKLLENNVTNVGIFPEGKRSKDYNVHEFKAGSLKIATKVEHPIVVASIYNTFKVNKNFPFKRTKVDVSFIDLIETKKDTNTIELANHIKNLIKEDIKNK